MTRHELEHILRASAAILGETEFIVIGSQSILGAYPEADGPLALSKEVDLYPVDCPDRAEILTAAIGEGSHFHSTFGVYADGVGPNTAVLPAGWRRRLVRVQNDNTHGATGWCLDPIDLAVAKYVAERPKDIVFTLEMVRRGLIDPDTFAQRLDATPIDEAHKRRVAKLFERQRATISREKDLHRDEPKQSRGSSKPTVR